jgi:hypothetical protein
VIIVQSPRMTSLQVGVVADIVIQLLGRPGIDVAMVTSLEPDDESTDRLMLTSLENDLAVIDWRSVEQTVASLQRLNVAVTRAPHALDADAPIVRHGSRKLYGIDLRSGFSATEVVESLTKLLEQRQVVTVSLLGLGGPSKLETKASSKPLGTSEVIASQSTIGSIPASRSSNAAVPTTHHRTAPVPSSPAESFRDDASLDDLVDDLNDFN